ncbi:MAG: baseplate J/gp47 family protein [Bacteroidota bacterium]
MAKCSDKKTPLQRSGIARYERLLPGMQSGYVNVDEKTFADWIVFAKSFAQYLDYYELNGARSGDWTPFFSNDVSAVLGTIAIQDAAAYKRSIKERLDFLKNNDHVTQLPAAERNLNDLFSAVLSFCKALDEYYRLLPNDVTLKSTVENLIKSSLSPALNRLLRYYKAARQLGYLKENTSLDWKVLGFAVKDSWRTIQDDGLSVAWWSIAPLATSWKDYYTNHIEKDESIFGNAALDLYFNSQYTPTTDYTATEWLQYMKMNHAANHNLFAGLFDQFLVAYSKLVSQASKDLLVSLESRNTHPAHYALFLAFLRLFRLAQNDINTITKRHLDFYYKEVLQLQPKAASPDSAHLITTLAKTIDGYILSKDTLFKAGKDSEGKDVEYALKDETTFNKVIVNSLRSVYIGNDKDDHAVGVVNNGRMFAAPMINSGDGVDAEITTSNKEWHPIANRLYSEGKVIDIKMPAATIGFAVASHYLFLQEGVRKVMLRLSTDNNAALTGKQYAVYLTTEKGWYQIVTPVAVVVNNNLNIGTEPCAEFSFTLAGDEPPITNYDVKLHGGNLNIAVPVLKVLLVNNDSKTYEYNVLRDISISKLEVAVEVGMQSSAYNQQGLKNILVSTDGGPVDTSKPFMPFGGQPRKDATLVIGNKEAFSKKNASVKLNVEWGGSDFPGSMPDTKFALLQGGTWVTKNNGLSMFNASNTQVQVFNSAALVIPSEVTLPFEEDYTEYGKESVKGFMRFTLNESFGHKEYQNLLSLYLISQTTDTPQANPPTTPYTPIIQSLYLSYSAFSDVINFNDNSEAAYRTKPASYFHLYPFGDAEQYSFLTNNSSHYLLPQFRHIDKDSKPVLHEGEFYIGFENLSAKQLVNVLFQVLDGSADPTISKPTEHIQWSYLSNNQWIDFKKQEISDGTMQLVQSGIIRFIIPADATTNNSLLPAGLLWIKASVADKTNAICKLLSVEAQAAIVTFKDNNNAADFLDTALPASTISKLKLPLSAVKKIVQPYASFGGRPIENSDAFYVRVSERLRHKARAITIWDYEHLILEAFPLIYKVKCLNHTKSLDAIYNEVLPGHVTIITIPDLKQRNDINPLRPYTSQAMLQAIDAFLRKRISCHVQLYVVNPVFEEVQIKFSLKLAKGFDDFTIYSAKLQEEITAFLSPWAYSADADISFGGKVYKSVLINFIEERPYVDYITDVVMSHYASDGTLIQLNNDEIVASTAKSILVSVPASKHIITQITDSETITQYECAMLAPKPTGKP